MRLLISACLTLVMLASAWCQTATASTFLPPQVLANGEGGGDDNGGDDEEPPEPIIGIGLDIYLRYSTMFGAETVTEVKTWTLPALSGPLELWGIRRLKTEAVVQLSTPITIVDPPVGPVSVPALQDSSLEFLLRGTADIGATWQPRGEAGLRVPVTAIPDPSAEPEKVTPFLRLGVDPNTRYIDFLYFEATYDAFRRDGGGGDEWRVGVGIQFFARASLVGAPCDAGLCFDRLEIVTESVAPIPLPPAAALLLTGLFGIGALRASRASRRAG